MLNVAQFSGEIFCVITCHNKYITEVIVGSALQSNLCDFMTKVLRTH